MTQINDDRKNKLEVMTGTTSGQTNDLLMLWLEMETGATGGLTDLWSILFDIALIPDGQRNDREMLWLEGQGFAEGSLSDRWAAYWAST